MNSTTKSLTIAALTIAVLIGGISSTTAGRIGGPGSTLDSVLAWDTDVYFLDFFGGQFARVVVDGDGDTDLDLYVYDHFGNLVAYDEDLTDYCIATWVPAFNGRFRIEIVNRGSVYNRYEIRTN